MPKPSAPLLRWLLVAAWMTLIFQASNDRQSWEHSSRLVEPLIRWLMPSASDQTVRTAVLFVRKCAHVTEFAGLTLLVWWALGRGAATGAGEWRWRKAALTLGIVILYAVSDELHQAFVPMRQGSALDVLVDSRAFGWQAQRTGGVLRMSRRAR